MSYYFGESSTYQWEILSKEIDRYASFKNISDKILFNWRLRDISIIQIYIPIGDSEQTDSERFRKTIEEIMKQLENRNFTILMRA